MIRVHELPVSEEETVTVTDCVCDWCGQAARLKGDHHDFTTFRTELNWTDDTMVLEDGEEECRQFCCRRCWHDCTDAFEQ